MKLQCPSCSADIEVGASVPAGQLMRCSSCQKTFATPSQAAPEAKAPEAKAGPAFASAGPPRPKDGDYGGAGSLAGAAGQVTDALTKMAGSIPVIGGLVKAIQPLLGAFSNLGRAIGKAAGQGGQTGGGGGGGGKAGGGGGDSVGTAASLAGALGPVGAALGAAAQVASAAVSALSGLTSAANALTAVYNPSLNQMLNRTYLDLQGTIGSGLIPVTQVAITSLRKFADAMVEPMRDVRPAVAGVAGAFGGVVNQLSVLFADVVTAMAPVAGVWGQVAGMFGSIIQQFINLSRAAWAILTPLLGALGAAFSSVMAPMQGAAELLNELARAVAAMAAGIGSIVGSLFSAIGGAVSPITGLFKQLGGGLQYLFRAIVTFALQAAALAARLLGGSSAVNAMIRSLEGPKEGGSVGMAAAQNAQVTGLANLTNSLYAAAFTAQKVGPEGKKEDPMKDMVDALKSIRDGGGTTITKAITDAAPAVAKALGEVISKTSSAAVEYVGGGVYNAGRSAYDSTIGAAGRYLFGE